MQQIQKFMATFAHHIWCAGLYFDEIGLRLSNAGRVHVQAHSPLRITGTVVPSAFTPSISTLSEPIIQSI